VAVATNVSPTENTALEGTLSVEGCNETSSFAGWFELLTLLEAKIGAPAQSERQLGRQHPSTGETHPWG
jgi:hypothetical protein